MISAHESERCVTRFSRGATPLPMALPSLALPSLALLSQVLLSLVLLAPVLPAQSASDIARRVDAVRDGDVRLSFPARPGVCGNGSSWIRTSDSTRVGSFRGGGDVDMECQEGPVRVVIARRDGRSVDVRTYVGGRWRTDRSATDLGMLSAAAAVSWLIAEVEEGDESSAKDALMPLTIADADVPWARVLNVARDASRPRDVRTQALFWSAQAAGDKAAQEIGVIASTDPDVDVRTQAVFALSRRADGVEHLLTIARTSKDREVKKAAYFWLGQSKDPRAAALFAEVLGKPAR